jgi:hypothetical protein
MINKHIKVWKVVSRKPLSGKQTWPKGVFGIEILFAVFSGIHKKTKKKHVKLVFDNSF